MERNSPYEFVARVDAKGNLVLPELLRNDFAGRKVHVRISEQGIVAALKERNVSEEEVERIGNMQLETREQVVKFLLSEAVLKNSAGFVGRAKRIIR